jgi:hypothetical protein
VRNENSENSSLKFDALPEDFAAVNFYTFMNPTVNDDCSYNGCNFVMETRAIRENDNSIYSSYDYLVDAVRSPVRDALNLTQAEVDDANFLDMHTYCGAIQCLKF